LNRCISNKEKTMTADEVAERFERESVSIRTELEKLKKKLDALEHPCERCGAHAPTIVTLAMFEILTVSLCRKCVRLWETDKEADRLIIAMSSLSARIQASIRAGEITKAGELAQTHAEMKRDARDHAHRWLHNAV
jgi:phage regulator Rha-like protein